MERKQLDWLQNMADKYSLPTAGPARPSLLQFDLRMLRTCAVFCCARSERAQRISLLRCSPSGFRVRPDGPLRWTVHDTLFHSALLFHRRLNCWVVYISLWPVRKSSRSSSFVVRLPLIMSGLYLSHPVQRNPSFLVIRPDVELLWCSGDIQVITLCYTEVGVCFSRVHAFRQSSQNCDSVHEESERV